MTRIAHGKGLFAKLHPTPHQPGKGTYIGKAFLYVGFGDMPSHFTQFIDSDKNSSGVFRLTLAGKFPGKVAVGCRAVEYSLVDNQRLAEWMAHRRHIV